VQEIGEAGEKKCKAQAKAQAKETHNSLVSDSLILLDSKSLYLAINLCAVSNCAQTACAQFYKLRKVFCSLQLHTTTYRITFISTQQTWAQFQTAHNSVCSIL
jgi:hypothetical protein